MNHVFVIVFLRYRLYNIFIGDDMKKATYLLAAVIGNGFGSAIMFQTHLGMSAYGASASNVSLFFGISPGFAFIVLSALFYVVAILVRKRFVFHEFVLSTLFLLTFSFLLDLFILLLPDFTNYPLYLKLIINLAGMLILLFSISLHLHVNIAVHPMDVFLRTMQLNVFKDVANGTYFSYFCAFTIAIIFGLLAGGIRDIGIGTVMTLVTSGLIMALYDKYIISKL